MSDFGEIISWLVFEDWDVGKLHDVCQSGFGKFGAECPVQEYSLNNIFLILQCFDFLKMVCPSGIKAFLLVSAIFLISTMTRFYRFVLINMPTDGKNFFSFYEKFVRIFLTLTLSLFFGSAILLAETVRKNFNSRNFKTVVLVLIYSFLISTISTKSFRSFDENNNLSYSLLDGISYVISSVCSGIFYSKFRFPSIVFRMFG
jgi:hypothetical protein